MRKLLVLLMFLSLCGTAGLFAQETTSEITGVVTDEENNPLPGVTVEAVSPNLVGKASTFSDASGKYRLRALVSGTYRVTFTLQGFATMVQENVPLRTGQVLTLNMGLKQAALEETVTVTAASPLIDVKRSSTATNITKDVFSRLPVGRNFNSLVSLAPSVNNEAWLGGISVDGASGSENMFFVDGMDITDLYDGDNTLNVRLEHLEEVQVKQSGYEAEFGGSMGGVINVITRSGGNEFHGEASFYYDGSALDGTPRESLRLNPLDSTQYEYFSRPEKTLPGLWNRYEFGLNVGGYILKDRLWFYGGFLPTIQKQSREVTFIVDDSIGTYNQTQFWPRMQAKITAQPMSNLRLSASYANDTWKWDGLLPADDGSSPPENDPFNAFSDYSSFGRRTPDMTFSFRADYIASPNLFFSLTSGYYYTNQGIGSAFTTTQNCIQNRRSMPSSLFPASLIRAANWTNYPLNEMWNTKKNEQTRLSAAIDATYYLDLAGEHAWKVGFQFARIAQDVDNLAWADFIRLNANYATRPRYYVDHNGDYWSGIYGYFEVRGTGPQDYGTKAIVHSDRYAFFIQDSWTIGKRLTLNFGLRTEQESIPSMATAAEAAEYGVPENFEPIKFKFQDKLAPRFGFSYDVFGDSSLKIFGSWGIFYDVMKLELAHGSFGGFAWKSQYYTWDVADYTTFVYPYTNYGTFIEELDWRIPSWDTVQDDLKPMSQVEYVLGAEKQLWENFSLKLRGVYKHLLYAIEDIGIMTDLGESYFIANPGSDWVNSKLDPNYLPCPTAKRDYYAVDFAIEKRYSDNWLGGFSYTWSRLWGNYSGLASSDEFGRTDPNVNRYFDLWMMSYDQYKNETKGLMPTDRTHQFKLWGSYVFPFGLTLGLNAIAMSGTPMTTEFFCEGVQGYYPLNREYFLEDLGGEIVKGRRTPFLYRVDAFVQYELKLFGKYTLQFNANVTNIFNFKISQRVYSLINVDNIYQDYELYAAGYDFQQVIIDNDMALDPRYGRKMNFTDPWAARVGFKFIF